AGNLQGWRVSVNSALRPRGPHRASPRDPPSELQAIPSALNVIRQAPAAGNRRLLPARRVKWIEAGPWRLVDQNRRLALQTEEGHDLCQLREIRRLRNMELEPGPQGPQPVLSRGASGECRRRRVATLIGRQVTALPNAPVAALVGHGQAGDEDRRALELQHGRTL